MPYEVRSDRYGIRDCGTAGLAAPAASNGRTSVLLVRSVMSNVARCQPTPAGSTSAYEELPTCLHISRAQFCRQSRHSRIEMPDTLFLLGSSMEI